MLTYGEILPHAYLFYNSINQNLLLSKKVQFRQKDASFSNFVLVNFKHVFFNVNFNIFTERKLLNFAIILQIHEIE